MNHRKHLACTLVLIVAATSGPGASAQSATLETFAPPTGRIPATHLGPSLLVPREVGIGLKIENVMLRDLNGDRMQLYDVGGQHGLVIVVRDPGCPVSRRYGSRVAKLAEQYARHGFRFLFIYPSETLDTRQRTADRDALDVDGAYVDQGSFALAQSLGVKSTGDTFVLDDDFRLQFRGAVDDQFGLGYTRAFPTRNYLRNALDALSSGRAVEAPATSAPGCYIDADPVNDHLFDVVPAGHLISERSSPNRRPSTEISSVKTTQNVFAERLNGKFRDDGLDLNWFGSSGVARSAIDIWRDRYSHIRLNFSLGKKPPYVFAIEVARSAQASTSPMTHFQGFGQPPAACSTRNPTAYTIAQRMALLADIIVGRRANRP